MEYRVERDALGEVRVPADAYYGAQTMRAIQNFPVSGQRPHPAFVRAMVQIKRAAALANMETGRLPREIGHAIVEAADEVLAVVPSLPARPAPGVLGRETQAPATLADQWVVDPYQAGAGRRTT